MARIHEIPGEIAALEQERREIILSNQIEQAAEELATLLGQDWSLLLEAVKDDYRDAVTAFEAAGGRLPSVRILLDEVTTLDLIPDLGL